METNGLHIVEEMAYTLGACTPWYPIGLNCAWYPGMSDGHKEFNAVISRKYEDGEDMPLQMGRYIAGCDPYEK